MEKILESFVKGLDFLATNPVYIIGIIAAGLFFTIVTKFVQIRYFFRGWKLMFKPGVNKEGTSSYKAAALAIGGRVGTGNIAGVTAAIIAGGPGAVFWMWAIAFIGMGTAFMETVLGQLYKEKTSERVYVGGPAYYIEKGLGKKFKPLALFYAFVMIFSFGSIFLALHASNIYSSTASAFEISETSLIYHIITGVIVLLTAIAAFGGMRVLLNITGVLTPFMTIGYILLVAVVIITNLDFIGTYFSLIFSFAFNPQALGGATLGTIITVGAKRGIFSNEAGQGSGAIAGATSSVKHPIEQGLVQMNTVFIDTFIICTLTSFVVLLFATQNGLFLDPTTIDQIKSFVGDTSSADIAVSAFSSNGDLLGKLLAIFFFMFAFSSLLGNMSYGIQNVKYLFENKSEKFNKIAKNAYAVWAVVMVLATPLFVAFSDKYENFNIFNIADAASSGLFYANVIALVLLYKKVKETLGDYDYKLKNDLDIKFDRKKFAKENHFDRT